MSDQHFIIRELEAAVYQWPLLPGRAIAWTHGVHAKTCCLVATVVDQDGHTGYGETVLLPVWTGEDAATAVAFVNGQIRPAVVGHAFDHPQEVAVRMAHLAWGWQAGRGAVDCAVWDLWAKRAGRTVVDLIADRPPAKRIMVRASIGGFDVGPTVELARQYHDLGVRVLKFKVGLPGIDDAARLAEARAAVGDEAIFTIDANCAYPTPDAAVRAYEAMAPQRIDLFEQPTPRRRITMLAEVRRRIDAAVMADDSVFDPTELDEVLALGACDFVSLYPTKNGGLTPCLAMAQTAADAGVGCAIGSCLETDLGQGAMAALAAGLNAFAVEGIGHDLQAALMYETSSSSPPLKYADGYVHVPDGPGFGVELDRQALKKYKVD